MLDAGIQLAILLRQIIDTLAQIRHRDGGDKLNLGAGIAVRAGARPLRQVVVDAALAQEAVAKREGFHQVPLLIKGGGDIRRINGLHQLIDAPGHAIELAQQLLRILIRGIALLHAGHGEQPLVQAIEALLCLGALRQCLS